MVYNDHKSHEHRFEFTCSCSLEQQQYLVSTNCFVRFKAEYKSSRVVDLQICPSKVSSTAGCSATYVSRFTKSLHTISHYRIIKLLAFSPDGLYRRIDDLQLNATIDDLQLIATIVYRIYPKQRCGCRSTTARCVWPTTQTVCINAVNTDMIEALLNC